MNTKLIAIVFVLMLSLTGLFAFAVNNYNPVSNSQPQKTIRSVLYPNGTLEENINNNTFYIHEHKLKLGNNTNTDITHNIMDETTTPEYAINIYFIAYDSSAWKPYFNTDAGSVMTGNTFYGLLINIYAVNQFGNRTYLGFQVMSIYSGYLNQFVTYLNYSPNIKFIEYSISSANIYEVNGGITGSLSNIYPNITKSISVNNLTVSPKTYFQSTTPNTEINNIYGLNELTTVNVQILYPTQDKYYITFTNPITASYKISINNKLYSTNSHNITVLLANGTYNIEIIYNSTDTYYGQFIVSGQDQTINLLNLSIYNSKSFASILYLVIVVLALIMILKFSYISLTFFTIGGIMMEYFGYLMGISYFTIDTILLSIVIIASVFVYRVMLE